MAIFVRPFKASDLEEFTPLESMGEANQIPSWATAAEESKLAVTGYRDGKIVACGGAHPINDEQGELWLRASEECLKHPVEAVRWFKAALEIVEDTFPFKQLNAIVNCSYKRGAKLVEMLGFSPTEVRTIDGKQVIIYSKLVNE
jgi:hypothetical protein